MCGDGNESWLLLLECCKQTSGNDKVKALLRSKANRKRSMLQTTTVTVQVQVPHRSTSKPSQEHVSLFSRPRIFLGDVMPEPLLSVLSNVAQICAFQEQATYTFRSFSDTCSFL